MQIQWRDESQVFDDIKRNIYFVAVFYTKPAIEFQLKKENIDDPKDTVWRISSNTIDFQKFIATDDKQAKIVAADMIKKAIYQILGYLI